MENTKLIRKFYNDLHGNKKLDLYSELLHPDLKMHIIEGMVINYSEYEDLLKTLFSEPNKIICELKEESFVDHGNFFAGRVLIRVDHTTKESTEFLLSIFVQFKDGKIVDFKLNSSTDWSLNDHFVEMIADVVNDFKISF